MGSAHQQFYQYCPLSDCQCQYHCWMCVHYKCLFNSNNLASLRESYKCLSYCCIITTYIYHGHIKLAVHCTVFNGFIIVHQHTDAWDNNSVCPSVCPLRSLEMAQHVVIISSPHSSPIILVFWVSNIFAKFWRGHPLQGREIQVEYKNFAIFDQWVAVSRKRCKITP